MEPARSRLRVPRTERANRSATGFSCTGRCFRGLPGGSRLPDGADLGPRRARAPGARRSPAGARGPAGVRDAAAAAGVRARAARARSTPLAPTPRGRGSSSSSAIWMAFRAAPLRRLSHARKSRGRSPRPGRGGYGRRAPRRLPAAWPGVGSSSSRTPGAGEQLASRRLRRERLLGLDPDRLGVADGDGHAHAGRAERQLRELEDLARLLAELRLLLELLAVESQSIARSCSAGGSSSRRCSRCAPAPDADWYVATRTARGRPRRGAA